MPQLRLMSTMFQGLFPPIQVEKVSCFAHEAEGMANGSPRSPLSVESFCSPTTTPPTSSLCDITPSPSDHTVFLDECANCFSRAQRPKPLRVNQIWPTRMILPIISSAGSERQDQRLLLRDTSRCLNQKPVRRRAIPMPSSCPKTTSGEVTRKESEKP